MNEKQKQEACRAMSEWLSHPSELGKAPFRIECAGEFDIEGLRYYIFKFKKSLLGDWLLGVCGGYEENSDEHCGHVFSEMEKYDEKTAEELAKNIVENIRSYWIRQAEMEHIRQMFKENLGYISETQIDAGAILSQFVRTESRFYLTVGNVDCPTGKIVVSDPLAYLGTGKFSPQMALLVKPGVYPAEVSIVRNHHIGIRMCTARLKITGETAVRYELAEPTRQTASAVSEDGPLTGFAVDAGMVCFCDAEVAEEYRQFLARFHEENPDANHYDDYFAGFFQESYDKLPAYQREGGDFIEWTNPDTGNRLVMIASGFGDGFYQCYWGYDDRSEVCELIIPMVNPDLFES